jgi:hypothetical protein
MPTLRDILDRFRPAPGPGRPGPVGVPSAETRTGADELEAVFAALGDVVAHCDAIRSAALSQAAEIRRTADVQLANLRSHAATTAAQTRAAAAAAVKAAGQARQAAELGAAQAEAARVRADGVERMTPYVAAAVSKVRNLPGSHSFTPGAGDPS